MKNDELVADTQIGHESFCTSLDLLVSGLQHPVTSDLSPHPRARAAAPPEEAGGPSPGL